MKNVLTVILSIFLSFLAMAPRAYAQSTKDIQEALLTLGYNVGEADGVSGPRTRWMIEAFQRSYGYSASGKLTDEGRNDLLNLSSDARNERRVIIVATHPKIERTAPVDVFNGLPTKYESLTFANGYHAALSRHRQIYVSSNKYRGDMFEYNGKIEKWQWDRANEIAVGTGDQYAIALMTIAKNYQPVPEFEIEVLPALSTIIEQAHLHPADQAYSFRAFASFSWQFDTANPCSDDNLKAQTLRLLQRVIELYSGAIANHPSKGKFLKLATECSDGSLSKTYKSELSKMAALLDPKALAGVARDAALDAMKVNDRKLAKMEFEKMHSLILDVSEGGYSERPQPGAIAGIGELQAMYKLGMEESVEQAAAIIVEDFKSIPSDAVYDATIGGDLLREVVEGLSAALVRTRQISALRDLGLYLSQESDPWEGATLGLGALLTRSQDEDAAYGAEHLSNLAAKEGNFLAASQMALQQAEASLRLGSARRAETALTKAISWSTNFDSSEQLENDIIQLRSELGLAQSEASDGFDNQAHRLAKFFAKACSTEVLGSASDLWVEVDMYQLGRDRKKAEALIRGGVFDALKACPSKHPTFRSSGRLFCHLSAISDETAEAEDFIRTALRQKWGKVEESTACVVGLAEAGRFDIYKPFAEDFHHLGEDAQFLTLAVLSPEERRSEISRRMRDYVPVDEWGTPNVLQFLADQSIPERKAALKKFRDTYIMAYSGASLRAYEMELILDQSFQEASTWLTLGLPDIAEALLAIDESVDPSELPKTQDGWADRVLSSKRMLRLVELHARVASERGDWERAKFILDPIVDAILGELTSSERVFASNVEQFAERGSQTVKLWLDAISRQEVSGDRMLLAQQALSLAISTASLSALDERLDSENPEQLRSFQDSRRALRILQNRPSSQRNDVVLAKLSNEVLTLSEELSSTLDSAEGAFGKLIEDKKAVEQLSELDAGLLISSHLEGAVVLGWIDRTGYKHHRLNTSSDNLRNEIELFRAMVLNKTSVEFDRKTAQRLFSKIFGWIEKDLPGDVRMVLDGSLSSLPFAALIDDQDRWFGVEANLRVSPTIAWALEPEIEIQKAENPFLGVAAPNYPSTQEIGVALAPLPETEVEVEFMAVALGADPTSAVLKGDDAREEDLYRLSDSGELANYRTLSFATHGLLEKDGRPAALALSKSVDGEHDGLLDANEVFRLRLNAELVILSACNTGGVRAGEGLSDLASAFFYAGARRLLVSHWDVDSGATLEIMRFIALTTAKGGQPIDGVREAMRSMSLPESPYSHPRYWAAFFVVG